MPVKPMASDRKEKMALGFYPPIQGKGMIMIITLAFTVHNGTHKLSKR